MPDAAEARQLRAERAVCRPRPTARRTPHARPSGRKARRRSRSRQLCIQKHTQFWRHSYSALFDLMTHSRLGFRGAQSAMTVIGYAFEGSWIIFDPILLGAPSPLQAWHSETQGFPYPCPPSFASARALGSGGSRTCGTCMSRPFWCAHPCSSHPADQRAAASSWACAGGPRTNNRRPTAHTGLPIMLYIPNFRSEVQRQARAPRPRSRPRHCCWWGLYLATRLRDACRRG